MDFKTGGQQVILRLVEAYGFSTRQMLCDHLGVSKSTLATRFMRDIFPAEWVIQCALETGVSLEWLTTGIGAMYSGTMSEICTLKNFKLDNGRLLESNYVYFDKSILPPFNAEIFSIKFGSNYLIFDKFVDELNDATWLIEIDGEFSVKIITKLPGNKVKITGENADFESSISDIKFIGKLLLEVNKK